MEFYKFRVKKLVLCPELMLVINVSIHIVHRENKTLEKYSREVYK